MTKRHKKENGQYYFHNYSIKFTKNLIIVSYTKFIFSNSPLSFCEIIYISQEFIHHEMVKPFGGRYTFLPHKSQRKLTLNRGKSQDFNFRPRIRRSLSTIFSTNSLKETLGFHFSSFRIGEESPINKSTSAGR